MSQPAKILIARGGAIGDFVVTLPILHALRERFPQSRLELLAIPSIASLAIEFGLADQIRDLNSAPFAPLFSTTGDCPVEIAQWLSTFDVIVSYLHDPEKLFETNVRRHSKAQFITGPHRPDERSNIHASSQLLEALQTLGIRARLSDFTLPHTHSPTHPLTLALHPGSGSPTKNWPAKNWLPLLHRLIDETPANFLLIGGEAERDRISLFTDAIPANRRQVAFNLPLIDLAHRLQKCRAFIGHDSGITHLAAVLGLDGIALWGPSNREVWHPLNDRIQVLHHPEGLAALPVDCVYAALKPFLIRSHVAKEAFAQGPI